MCQNEFAAPRWGSLQRSPTSGAYSAPPDHQAGFKALGLLLRGGEGEGKEGGGTGKGGGERGKGRERVIPVLRALK